MLEGRLMLLASAVSMLQIRYYNQAYRRIALYTDAKT